RAIADLAQAVDALVGIDANQRACHRSARDHGHAQVGDLQVRRLGVGISVLHRGVERIVRPKGRAQTCRKNVAPARQLRGCCLHVGYSTVIFLWGRLIACPQEIHVRVGVFTALLAQMPLDGVLATLKGLGVSPVESGTGNYPGDPHCKLSLLDDKAARKDFKQMLDDNGISISALSCHGNPLHPNPAIAKQNQDVSKRTILLAEKLGVPVVIDFSGCPGDSDKAKYPNWVTCPWPPEYLDVLAWQ